MEILSLIESKIITLQGKWVILDSDIAALYGVETKRINEAVYNNPDKFPQGYIIELSNEEWESIRSKISTLKTKGQGQHTKFFPKAFTEKGLYMLATILKSPQATQTTIAIIETFTKLRELGRGIKQMAETSNEEEKQQLMQQSGKIIAEMLDNDLKLSETETTIELNFAVLKLKHTIKAKRTD